MLSGPAVPWLPWKSRAVPSGWERICWRRQAGTSGMILPGLDGRAQQTPRERLSSSAQPRRRRLEEPACDTTSGRGR